MKIRRTVKKTLEKKNFDMKKEMGYIIMKTKMTLKKAVSPLIATVLLIAITLAIGGFMSVWTQQITKQQAEESVLNSKPECRFVGLDTEDDAFNASADPPELTFYITNSGTRNVLLTKIEIVYSSGVYGFAGEPFTANGTTLESGVKYPMKITNVSFPNGTSDNLVSTIEEIDFITECPNADIVVKSDEITGTT